MDRRAGIGLGFYLGMTALAAGVIPNAASEARSAHRATAAQPEIGVASWYGEREQGKPTASGAPFDARKLTAAHPTLPLNSKAKVTNLGNGKSVEVTITDRGPAVAGRAIDLSRRAAERIGMTKKGLAPVAIEPLPSKVALR